MMMSLRNIAVVSTLSATVGYILGREKTATSTSSATATARSRSRSNRISNFAWHDKCKNCSDSLFANCGNAQKALQTCTTFHDNSLQDKPSWYEFLPIPFSSVSAASAPLERNSVPSSPSDSAVATTTANRVGEIMKFGYPNLDNIHFYEDYVVSYDRRNRIAHWVFEHIKGENCQPVEGVNRVKCAFKEDEAIHPYFRARNEDYKGSGYDRGHLAASSNHRHLQKAMDQTFLLTNIAPQVGNGFNRGIWNSLEKYTRALARKNRCVYVCTGPLYLPRKEPDGKQYVKYEIIGSNHVAVPTHFFKVLVIEDWQGQYEMKCFVLPNEPLPGDVQLKVFQRPVESIERAAGFLLFEKIPRKYFKLINGEKPR